MRFGLCRSNEDVWLSDTDSELDHLLWHFVHHPGDVYSRRGVVVPYRRTLRYYTFPGVTNSINWPPKKAILGRDVPFLRSNA